MAIDKTFEPQLRAKIIELVLVTQPDGAGLYNLP
jgi:hypothetical protein